MNTKQLIGSNIFFLLFTVILAANLSSCEDEVGPAVADIQIVDSLGKAVPFATVTLACTSSTNPPTPCELEVVGIADEAGKFRYEFELPSVLKVISSAVITRDSIAGTPPDTTVFVFTDSICGEDFITLKEDETNQKTIVLYGCN